MLETCAYFKVVIAAFFVQNVPFKTSTVFKMTGVNEDHKLFVLNMTWRDYVLLETTPYFILMSE